MNHDHVPLDELIKDKQLAKSNFKQIRRKSTINFIIFVLINFFILKFIVAHPQMLTHTVGFIWMASILLFLEFDKFYFGERLKQQKAYYHNCLKEIEKINSAANDALKEKELLEKKLKTIPTEIKEVKVKKNKI